MRSRRWIFAILFIFTSFGLTTSCYSQDANDSGWSSHPIQYETSIRAEGLGGAYVGLVDDASATFYNPAGLMRVDGPQLMGMFDHLGGNTLYFSSALAIPRSKWLGDFWGRYMAIGAAWKHLYSGGTYYTDESGRRRKSGGLSEGAVFVSVAAETDLWEQFNGSLGVSLKTLYGQSEDTLLTSTLDIGFQFQMLSFGSTPQIDLIPLRFGIMCENCVGSKGGSFQEGVYYAPRNWRFGLSYAGVPKSVTFWPQSMRPTLTIQLDMEDDFNSRRRIRAGVEFAKVSSNGSPIALRVGVADVAKDTWEWSVSVGIKLPLRSATLGLDLPVREVVHKEGNSARTSGVGGISLTYTHSQSNSAQGLRERSRAAKLVRVRVDSLEREQISLGAVITDWHRSGSASEGRQHLDSLTEMYTTLWHALEELKSHGSPKLLKRQQRYFAMQALARCPRVDLCATTALLANLKGSSYWSWRTSALGCRRGKPPPAEGARTLPSSSGDSDD